MRNKPRAALTATRSSIRVPRLEFDKAAVFVPIMMNLIDLPCHDLHHFRHQDFLDLHRGFGSYSRQEIETQEGEAAHFSSFRGVLPGPRKARPDDRVSANYSAHLRA